MDIVTILYWTFFDNPKLDKKHAFCSELDCKKFIFEYVQKRMAELPVEHNSATFLAEVQDCLTIGPFKSDNVIRLCALWESKMNENFSWETIPFGVEK